MNTVNFNDREIISASSDAFLFALGGAVDKPHPMAQNLNLQDIAKAFDEKTVGLGYTKPASVFQGMNTPEFKKKFSDSGMILANEAYTLASDHLGFSGLCECKNFKEINYTGINGDFNLQLIDELKETKQGYVFFSDYISDSKLSVYSRLIGVSRNSIINNNAKDIGKIFAKIGTGVSRIEQGIIAKTLESNPVQSDGIQTFVTENTISSELSTSSIGKAMSLLQTMTNTNGERLGCKVKSIVCDPTIEIDIRTILTVAGLRDIGVYALADLPLGRWYAIPDSRIEPSIVLLRLIHNNKIIEVSETKNIIDFDGIMLKATAYIGASIVSRSIIKGGI